MASKLTWHNPADWDFKSGAATPRGARARRGIAAESDMPEKFLAPGVTVSEVVDAAPRPERRSGEAPFIDLSVEVAANETYALAVRHPSGALTFHFGEQTVAPGRAARRGIARPLARAIRFQVPMRAAGATGPAGATGVAGARRGIISNAAKVIVLKVTGEIADAVLPRLVSRWEARAWQNNGLAEGWFKLTPETLVNGALKPGIPNAPAPERTLLLLHGTFSNAASAFKGLASTNFFQQVAATYGDRIYAFNHFSLSKTPEDNARDLIAALPNRAQTFDVITHSRGGLVLRNLVERRDALGAPARRFQLGRAALVAAPNDGTPLATPSRWEETVGWVANLVEVFPDNPFTVAAEWVSEAIVWLARRAGGSIPGLASMDRAGRQIADLQLPPGPPPGVYTALVSNYSVDENFALRMLDVGIDAFFGGANDLVVPTEGGWLIDRDAQAPAIPAHSIGCFGPGGNLEPPAGGVNHLNFFKQKDTADFLARALKGEPQGLAQIDPAGKLPVQRQRRGIAASAARPAPIRPAPALAAPSQPQPIVLGKAPSTFSDAFQLTIMKPEGIDGQAPYQLIATYGGARVIEAFPTKGGEVGERFRRIIEANIRIKNHIDGKPGVRPPQDRDLIDFGSVLFEALFPPKVRRLYDVARSRERAGQLKVIFTSTIPWLADKPWEFAYDVNRQTFLTTEDLHFVRNVITSIPAEKLQPKEGPLRILVAVAQPVGTGRLSADEEEAVIRRGFEPLEAAGLAVIDVLREATPNSMHRWISMGEYDVVHFIGHGVFRKPAGSRRNKLPGSPEVDGDGTAERFEEEDAGYLVFEDGNRGLQYVGFRTAREILCQRGVRLVFLNACETGSGGHGDFNRGIAPAIVAAGLPAVVANQYKVLDQSATEFAQHFYWALAQGQTLGAAAREARIAVNYSIGGENIDWAVPVVYARDPESRLCEQRTPSKETLSTPLVSRSARRATMAHARRVAIWDMNHIFPRLPDIVDAMNRAQTRFGFEPVDFSAPTGMWRRQKQDNLQLDCNEAAEKLQYKPQELGVDYLFCITDRPLMYRDAESVSANNYTWWPSDQASNVLIFSTRFFDADDRDNLPPRVIANALVSALAGVLADVSTHGHSKHCPLYDNDELDMTLQIQPEAFDKRCRKTLAKEIPDDFGALEALLRVFD